MNRLISYIKDIFQREDRSAVVKKNILGTLVLKGISILISFLIVPLTIGYVNAELYGVWLTVASVMTWIHFLDLGFSQGLKNRLTEALAKEDFARGKTLVSTTYFMLLCIIVPACLIMQLLIPLVNWSHLLNVNEVYSQEITNVIHIIIAIACLQIIVNVLVSVVAAFQKVALSQLFGVVGSVFSLVIIIILRATCPPSLIVLALTFALMPVLVTIIASLICFNGPFKKVAPNWKSVDFSCIKDLFGLGYKFFLINIQVIVLYWSTNVLISNVSSPLEVTKYNIAYKMLSAAMMVYTIIINPLWPAYTDAYARGDFNWMKTIRKKMHKILFLFILGCVVLVVLSQPIYHIWIGDKVEIPNLMTILVALYVIAYSWMSLNGTIISALGKLQLNLYMSIVVMIVHIPLSLFLGKYIGAYGVVLSLFLFNLMYAIIGNIQANKILNNNATGIWNK